MYQFKGWTRYVERDVEPHVVTSEVLTHKVVSRRPKVACHMRVVLGRHAVYRVWSQPRVDVLEDMPVEPPVDCIRQQGQTG